MKDIKAVIFDMDGTIIDTEPVLLEIVLQGVEFLGFKPSKEFRNKLSKYNGVRLINKMFLFEEEFGPSFDTEALFDYYMTNRIDMSVKIGIKTKPGFFELLNYLKKTKLRLALCTSTEAEPTNIFLNAVGIDKNIFEVIVCGEDVKKTKPDPESYLLTCKKLCVKPKECIVFEDSAVGAIAASSAGCNTIMIPENPPSQDIKSNCIAMFDDMFQAKEYLQKVLK
ncbi:MAG: HAD family phosphatase [Christensenellaceae bacterium]|jgi:HAD superfamily hydrolase (TIGR01509 family)|nr:HAD family phosphatase [Christensenellaceae bacterium]